MKKVKCFMAIAAFALYVSACSSSRTNSGTTTSPGMTDSTTTNPGTTNPTTTDSSQQR